MMEKKINENQKNQKGKMLHVI